MVRENPIKDCSITKEYGTVSETFYLSGDMHIVTDPTEFAEFWVYISKPEEYSDITISFKEHPVECGEWHITKNDGFGVRFTSKKEEATFIANFGDTTNSPTFTDISY
ncbi:MAG: hypothetical protein MJ003_04735 [Paludibacteraceae bacterium]|nr:hypothetical protein [Paludibacteraceae bacterium]